MDLSIIIVNFNVKNLLRGCLGSLERERRKTKKLEIEVLVVDNASTDDSSKMVKKSFPQVKLTKNKTNLGFAKAVNQGIKRAKGEFILLLNPDIVVKENALKQIVSFAESRQSVGVVGGRLLNPDGSGQPSVFHLSTFGGAIKEFWLGKKGTFQKYLPKVNKPQAVEAVSGAAMLIPKTIIKKIGLFDEHYFMYFEDLDYCRRVKEAGLKVFYCPQTEFIHYHGQSGKKIPEKVSHYLVESSKIYHGKLKHYLINLIIKLGQKWQK